MIAENKNPALSCPDKISALPPDFFHVERAITRTHQPAVMISGLNRVRGKRGSFRIEGLKKILKICRLKGRVLYG